MIEIPKFDTKHANGELRKRGDQEWFWVRIPVSMDSLSRQRLVQTGAGREAYCVYMHLVCLAAKDEPRGILADERGPFSLQDIFLRTSIPVSVLSDAIKLLCDESVGWIVYRESNGIVNSDSIDILTTNSSYISNSESNNTEKENELVFPLGADCLDTPDFRAKWFEWLAYRREARLRKWTKRTEQTNLLKLAKAGHDTAIATIDLSIGNGYQGLDPDWLAQRGAGKAGSGPKQQAEQRRADAAKRGYEEDENLTFD